MGEPMLTEKLEGGENAPEDGCSSSDNVQKRFWRSASWSSSHSAPPSPGRPVLPMDKPGTSYQLPLTPRQQGSRRGPTLPPLLTSGRVGNDEARDWAPLTPRRDINRMKNGLEIKLDLAAVQRCRDSSEPTEMQMKRDKFAFFEKECSRVAEHIYLGSDAVARNRETLLANKITHVLNCVGFICKEYFRDDFKYHTLWLQDSPSEDITSILYDVFDYFEEVRELGGRVFVHCCQGVSRSTALVIAYLMWREGRSFEDAFQDVKAARGITNPNMGFACQLLQAQKRVHASPASPNSILRMYRMAPHSPYDALHLVPKTINNPSPTALDSRGAFVVHVPSAIFVWIGRKCEKEMEILAKAAAGQVVRYERAQAPIMSIFEGEEPEDFWEAFSKGSSNLEGGYDRLKGDLKRVEAYDLDFELYHRALQGVVPPSGAVVTHIPARVSGWSRLRKKFFSGSVKEKVAAIKESGCTRSGSPHSPLSETSTPSSSPPASGCPSPSYFFSASPTPSPASSYSWSPASSDESSASSRYTSPAPSPLRFPSAAPSGKPSSVSLAERRGGMPPSLFLGSMVEEPPPTPRFGKTFSFKSDSDASAGLDASATPSPDSDRAMEIDNNGDKKRRIYEWPRLKNVDLSGRHDLDSSSVYILVNRVTGRDAGDLFIWVGSKAGICIDGVGSPCLDEAGGPNWEQIGAGFLKRMDIHSDKPASVIKEGEEPEELWEKFFSL
ncbi:protein-tyrosine-phosphatase MKP1-like [Selaginella moellendorffii]|uniref:protein-tyrosine-phosphatase MKP1-like n=1 Tax=Selaginella moellendorffii TaxID=88036 RepID=UPI000D1C5B03|nr:protein-tyrosine-phosphatase MKP1-like [Selaginella moellendorffii]|eukprot:XP_024531368.1 protein-tyrosine-phosphatase MKP1-like [Selaginella moellendorffii]